MIKFSNNSVLDLECLRHFGASVKSGESPIGKYGSGLKFAIATLIRNSVSFQLTLSGELVDFYTKPKVIRGAEFDVIYASHKGCDIELPITTQAGLEWETWQAVREIYSNCMDEGGKVTKEDSATFEDVCCDSPTSFALDLPADFLDTFCVPSGKELLFENESIQIFDGPSEVVYYQGFKASPNYGSELTYNVKSPIKLTEDRYIKELSQVGRILFFAALEASVDVSEKIITSNKSIERAFIGHYCHDVPESYEISDGLAAIISRKDAIAGFFSLAISKGIAEEAPLTLEELVDEIDEICRAYGVSMLNESGMIKVDARKLNSD